MLVDSRLLLSYNHLLLIPRFTRLPPIGDGVAGGKFDSLKGELRAKGDEDPREESKEDPKLGLRAVSLFDIALYSNGLDEGENVGPDETLCPEKLAPVDKGDALRPAELAVRDPETRYFGGVT